MGVGNIPGTTTTKVYKRDLLDPTFRYLGAWNGTTVYIPGDYITLSGSSYVCIVQNVNQQPPNTNYWNLVGTGPLTSGSTGQVLIWNGTSWAGGLVANANVDSAAGIVYSKLNLAGSIVNADVSASAGIALSKLAGYPSDGTKFAAGDGTWKAASGVGSVWDHAENSTLNITSGAINTESTGTAILTGNSITYDGTAVWIEIYIPQATPGPASGISLQFTLWIDTTVLGTIIKINNTNSSGTMKTLMGKYRYTPTAGAHTFKITAWSANSGWQVQSGAGGSNTLLPAFLHVSKA